MKSVYRIKNVEITADKTYPIRDDMIVDFYIMEDYVNRKFPIVKMILMLDTDMINKILTFSTYPLMKLEIYEDILSSQDESIIDTQIYLKDTFSIIPKDEKTNYKITKDKYTILDENNVDEHVAFPIYLLKMGNVSYFNKDHSFVFRDSSKSDVLKAIFKMKDIPSGLAIVTPPDVNKVDQIIIPQGNLVTNIQYLNNRYGLYKSIPIIYQDLFNIYCLCTAEPNIHMEEGSDEYNVIFSMPDETSDKLVQGGYTIDKAKKIFDILINSFPTIRDFSNSVSVTQFGTLMSVDKSGNVDKITMDNTTNKLKFIYQDNPLSADQIINTEYSSSKQVSIEVQDISLRYFKPYKIYKLEYPLNLKNSYDVHGKKFMMTGISTVFSKTGLVFNTISTITLKEIK